MKQTSDLFELIKSMSKSEKRYFKLMSSFHEGEKGYIKLFDIIEAQKKYNEEAIEKKLNSEPYINHLSVVKNRLYHGILSSLELFKKNETAELRSALNKIEILFNKELYKQAEKLLKKTKALAEEREEFLILLDVYRWETRIIRASSYKGENDESINNLYNNERIIAEKYIHICDYNKLTSQYFIHKQLAGNVRTKEGRKKLQSFADSIFLKDESLADSVESKAFYYALNASIHFNNKNYTQAYNYGNKLVLLLESKLNITGTSQGSYVHALHNLLIYQFHLNKIKELDQTLHKLRTFNAESKTIEMLCFFFASVIDMEVCNHIADFPRADKTIKQIEKYLDDNRGEFPNKRVLLLYFLIASNLFIRGDYKKSLRWTNKILNEFNEGVRADIYNFMRLFNLLIHFELGNFDLVEYQLSSTYKALNKQNSLYKLEAIIMEFMRESVKKELQKKDFTQLKEKLQSLSENEEEKSGLGYFDFIAWTESKIKNVSLAKVIKEKGIHMVTS